MCLSLLVSNKRVSVRRNNVPAVSDYACVSVCCAWACERIIINFSGYDLIRSNLVRRVRAHTCVLSACGHLRLFCAIFWARSPVCQFPAPSNKNVQWYQHHPLASPNPPLRLPTHHTSSWTVLLSPSFQKILPCFALVKTRTHTYSHTQTKTSV